MGGIEHLMKWMTWSQKKIKKEISEIIRRSFYKSPVTDLVGGGKMNTPIGKIFTMSGNKPKYES